MGEQKWDECLVKDLLGQFRVAYCEIERKQGTNRETWYDLIRHGVTWAG